MIAILLANGVEECEALVIHDLLFRANIKTELIGIETKEVISSHNVTIKVDKTIDEINFDDYDGLFLPGGMPGTVNLENDPNVNKMIDDFAAKNKYIFAICAAPSILIRKGLLGDNQFICFPSFENYKQPVDDTVCVYNNYITGKALSAAFKMAFKIIETMSDPYTAKAIMNQICYEG